MSTIQPWEPGPVIPPTISFKSDPRQLPRVVQHLKGLVDRLDRELESESRDSFSNLARLNKLKPNEARELEKKSKKIKNTLYELHAFLNQTTHKKELERLGKQHEWRHGVDRAIASFNLLYNQFDKTDDIREVSALLHHMDKEVNTIVLMVSTQRPVYENELP